MINVITGVTGAAPIWNRLMQHILRDQTDLWPKKPEQVVGTEICDVSGLRPGGGDQDGKNCHTRFEYFIKGTEPRETENMKRKVFVVKDSNKLAKPGQTENVEEQEKLILQDSFSIYCIDCSNESNDYTTVLMR